MYKYLITSLALAILFNCSTSCLGQNQPPVKKYEVPPFEPLDIIDPELGKAMQYRFPIEVETLIEKSFGNDDPQKAFIRLGQNKDTIEVKLYVLGGKVKEGKSDDHLNLLMNSTNRYYKLKNHQIPVVFDYDFAFSFPTFAITHWKMRIKFKARKWYDNAEFIKLD